MAKKSAGTLAIEQALKGLNAVGSSFTAPTYQAPDYNSIVNSNRVDYSKIFGNIDYSGVFEPSKTSDGGYKGPNIFDMISGTFGQLGGAVTNHSYNQMDGIKGLFDGKGNLGTDFLNLVNTFNPANSVADGVIAGGKKQYENWTDGELSWGDIPGVGVLNGMDKSWKRGEDIMGDQFGVQNKWGKIGGGIAIDILADPLTYFTGGATSAVKAGKVAELNKIDDLATGLGISKTVIKGLKNSDDFSNAAKQAYKLKYPDWSDSVINKSVNKLTNQIKTAQSVSHNKAINDLTLSIPKVNKTLKVGQITNPKNLLYRSEATLGSRSNIVNNLIDDVAGVGTKEAKQLEKAILQEYDVSDLSKLTKTMYDDIYKKLSPKIGKGSKFPDSVITNKTITKTIPNEIFDIKTRKGIPNETVNYSKTTVDDILKGMDERVAMKVGPLLKGLENTPRTIKSPVGNLRMDGLEAVRQLGPDAVNMFGEFAPKIMKTVKGKTADEVATAFSKAADDIAKATHTGTITKEADIPYNIYERTVEILKGGRPLDDLGKSRQVYKTIADLKKNPFNEMSNTKTTFEHWLDKKNPFNARTLNTGDKYLDSMGDVISDANSQRVGETSMYQRDIVKLERAVKKIPKDNREQVMKEAIYALEGKAPDSLGKGWKPSQEAIDLARQIKPILEKVKKSEMDAGVLNKARDNYFPHIVNKTEEQIKKIKEFKDANGDLNGLKLGSKNDKSRTGFQTLSDKDNYIAKLEKAIRKEKDPAVAEKMQEQMDEIADLFDTDVVSALTRRVKEGVRSKAMKAMHGELKKFGMYSDTSAGSNGLKELDAAEIRKLGLKEGQKHWMDPDVLDGLKRTDEVFTDEGMKKFARNVNATVDMWKSLVTTYKPSHYRNNILGNAFVNTAAGVGPSDYNAARKLLKGYRKGTLTDDEMKLVKTAYSKNVLSGGFVSDSMFNMHFDDPTKLEKLQQKVSHNGYVNTMKGLGEAIDDQFRMANFMSGMKKYGGNVNKSAAQVRKYLFNYNELTNKDRLVRKVVPFWNWTKNNLPLQMGLLMENPKFAMNIDRFQEFFNKDQEGADYQKETGIKVPFTDYYTGISSPLNDLNLLTNPTSLFTSSSPAIQIPMSIWNNKDTFTKNPISYGSESTQLQDIPAYLASKFGITDNIVDAATGTKGIGESLINLFNPVSEVRED